MVDAIATEFKKYVSPQEAMISVYVYLEISEVRKYYDVQYIFNEDIKKIVITGKRTKKDNFVAFVPVAVFEKLDFLKLQNFITCNPGHIVYIVVAHVDSTCVYYQITDGLLELDNITGKRLKENKREKLDSELRKHKSIIKEAALLSHSVNIPQNIHSSEENPRSSVLYQ